MILLSISKSQPVISPIKTNRTNETFSTSSFNLFHRTNLGYPLFIRLGFGCSSLNLFQTQTWTDCVDDQSLTVKPSCFPIGIPNKVDSAIFPFNNVIYISVNAGKNSRCKCNSIIASREMNYNRENKLPDGITSIWENIPWNYVQITYLSCILSHSNSSLLIVICEAI